MYMLDTDTCSYIIKKRPPEVKRRLQELSSSEVHISVITYAELIYGATRCASSKITLDVIEAFVTRINILPWDQAAARAWASTRYSLEKAGQPIGNLDTMIAAHALSHQLIVVTNNTRHFSKIEGLVIENWVGSVGNC